MGLASPTQQVPLFPKSKQTSLRKMLKYVFIFVYATQHKMNPNTSAVLVKIKYQNQNTCTLCQTVNIIICFY